jgi:hypothetical protein
MNEDNTEVIDPPKAVNPFAERANAEEAKPKKVSLLDLVTTRKRRRPMFICLYGPAGSGKSTWGASSESPIFIQTERGTDHLSVPRFPIPKNFVEFYHQLSAIVKEEHDYKTLVIDTIDALELLIIERVCAEGKCRSVDEYAGGYGKGWTRCREILAGVLRELTALSERMNVVLIGHSHIRSIADPTLSAPYDSFELKLDKKASELIYQFVDAMLFVKIETTLSKENPRSKKGRAIIGNDRIMITEPTTGVVAKNRWQLEAEMPFSWDALTKGMTDFYDGK